MKKCRVFWVFTLGMICTAEGWGVSWKDLPEKVLLEKGQGEEEGSRQRKPHGTSPWGGKALHVTSLMFGAKPVSFLPQPLRLSSRLALSRVKPPLLLFYFKPNLVLCRALSQAVRHSHLCVCWISPWRPGTCRRFLSLHLHTPSLQWSLIFSQLYELAAWWPKASSSQLLELGKSQREMVCVFCSN